MLRRHIRSTLPLFLTLSLTAACGDGEQDPTPDPIEGQDQGTQTRDMNSEAPDQGTTPQEDMSDPGQDMGSPGTEDMENQADMSTEDMSSPEDMGQSEDMSSPEDMGAPPTEVPTEGDALFAWLQAGNYLDYDAESAVHASTGPHGGDVRTFLNKTLYDSLAAGNATHPVGSAAIKELHDAGGVRGWAVEVKIAETGGGGDDWYWYENFSTTDNSNPVADGTGVGLCANCHSGGTDYVLTPWPLQ